MNNYQVITSHDKETRDELYDRLRASDDPQEAQVVKFSGNEEIPGEVSVQKDGSERKVYRSTWSVAYPINGDKHERN
jgi:hypothetical protein